MYCVCMFVLSDQIMIIIVQFSAFSEYLEGHTQSVQPLYVPFKLDSRVYGTCT